MSRLQINTRIELTFHLLDKSKNMEGKEDPNSDHQGLVEIGQIIYMGEIQNSTDLSEVVELPVLKPAMEKPKNTRSPVYKFFEWVDDVKRWKCCLCEVSYPLQQSGSTGSMVNHMNRKHKLIYANALSEIKTSKVENRSITKEIFRQKVIMFMVCSDQAHIIVEDPFFRDLIDYCSGGNDDCKLFCAKTAKGIIDDLYLEHKTNLTKMLQNNTGKISFIIDCWTSSNQHPFQGVVARWISDDWVLHNSVIDLTILSGSHNGINIANSFWGVLLDFDLCDKLLSVTTDNATNMDTMFEELEKLAAKKGIYFDSANYRIRCFAHILNLASRAMIKMIGDGDVANYPSDDESDGEDEVETKKSKELPVVTKIRKGVVSIRKSPQRREMFTKQCQVAGIPHKNLLRDVRTRFNATLAMIERAKEMKLPFDMTLRCTAKLRKHVLDDDEWYMIDELIKLLSPFKEATVMLSNEHSPTLSRISTVYQLLFNHLEKYTENEEEVPSKRAKKNHDQERSRHPQWLVQAAESGWEKLKKYYPSSDGLVHIVATDPRYKLVWFKATGWPKDWIDYSRKCVTELYKSKYLPGNMTQNDKKTESSTANDKDKPCFFSDLFNEQMRNYQKRPTDDDLKRYLSEGVVDPDMLIEGRTGIKGVLGWWKIHEKEFPILSKMAKDFLPASGTGIPVERLFSSGPDIISSKRECLSAESIRTLVCLKSWLKSGESFDAELHNAITHKLGVEKTPNEEEIF